jgi:hypothetical protein
MEERKFLEELNLIKEKAVLQNDISLKVMEKIKSENNFFVWKLAALFFPASVVGLIILFIVSFKLNLLNYIIKFSIIPPVFYMHPFYSFFAYVLSSGLLISILLATIVKGGKQIEMLLPSR